MGLDKTGYKMGVVVARPATGYVKPDNGSYSTECGYGDICYVSLGVDVFFFFFDMAAAWVFFLGVSVAQEPRHR